MFAKVHVPLPLFVAGFVWPLTVTEIVAPGSLTVPVSAGVLSAVLRVFTVTVGADVSMVSSLVVASVPTFDAASVARTTTL